MGKSHIKKSGTNLKRNGKKKFSWLYPSLAIAVIGLISVYTLTDGSAEYDATVYKSPTCGCCDLHTDYMQGDFNVVSEYLNLVELNSLKRAQNIPSWVQSCHTFVIDGYFVEGHIPKEVIEHLLEDRPDIAGIALPGMPSGSPGMPGVKKEDWVIYAINHDESYDEYMSF